jgi:ankyrin repeat protein
LNATAGDTTATTASLVVNSSGMRALLEALKEWDDESEAIRTAKVERIISGNKEVVNSLVQFDENFSCTPLFLTIAGGFKEATALLLKHGASVNAAVTQERIVDVFCDRCALDSGCKRDIVGTVWSCVECSNFDLCDACHTAFAHNGNVSIHTAGHTFTERHLLDTPLFMAIQFYFASIDEMTSKKKERRGIVDLLRKHGARVGGCIGALGNYLGKALTEDDDEMAEMIISMANGNKRVVNCLVTDDDGDGDRNRCMATPLFIACGKGKKKVAALLLQQGASVNKGMEMYGDRCCDECRKRGRDDKIVGTRWACDAPECADFDLCDTCHTAFAHNGKVSIHTAGHTFHRSEAPFKSTCSPMMGAIIGGHKEVADLLIKHGVKVSQAEVKYAEGQSLDEGQSEVVALLKKHVSRK